jgi:hypothetical protein
MSARTCRSSDGKVVSKIVPPRLRIPWWKGLGADSEEKHEPVSDIDTAVVDGLEALDPKWPIREADIVRTVVNVRAATSSRLAYRGGPRSSSGSLAMFAAMRHVSSRVSSLAAVLCCRLNAEALSPPR